jgi:ABC-type glycerol-3-phosphate transport system substrate-binding protein
LEWRTDLAAQAGITTPPATWDELKADLPKLAAHLHGRNAVTLNAVPMLHDLQEAWIMSASKHPFTKDGLIDWASPEAQQALVFMKQLSQIQGVAKGLDNDGDNQWQAGFVDFLVSPDSRAGWIKKSGIGTAAFAPLPERCAGCGSGQVFWGNGMSLLKGAQHPQEATDFLVWAFGPADSAGMLLNILKTGKTPIYSAYLHKIATDPSLASQRWQLPVITLLNHSLAQPATLYWSQENTAAQKWWPTYLSTNMTAAQYAHHVMADVAAAIQRSKG